MLIKNFMKNILIACCFVSILLCIGCGVKTTAQESKTTQQTTQQVVEYTRYYKGIAYTGTLKSKIVSDDCYNPEKEIGFYMILDVIPIASSIRDSKLLVIYVD